MRGLGWGVEPILGRERDLFLFAELLFIIAKGPEITMKTKELMAIVE